MAIKIKNSVNHKFNSMNDIEWTNQAIGHHYFSTDTMRFFSSKIYPCVYRGRFFVTSEKDKFSGKPREYSVRMAESNGSIETIGEFQAFSSKAQAERFITKNLTFETAKLIETLKRAFNTGKHLKALSNLIAKHPEEWARIKDLGLTSDWLCEWAEKKIG